MFLWECLWICLFNIYQLLENVRISLNKNSLDCLPYTFPSERASRERAFSFLKYLPTISVCDEEPLNPSVHSHLSIILHLFTCLSLALFIRSLHHLSLCISHSPPRHCADHHVASYLVFPSLILSIRLPLEYTHSRSHFEDCGKLGYCHVSLSPLHLSSSRRIISRCQDLHPGYQFNLSFIPPSLHLRLATASARQTSGWYNGVSYPLSHHSIHIVYLYLVNSRYTCACGSVHTHVCTVNT